MVVRPDASVVVRVKEALGTVVVGAVWVVSCVLDRTVSEVDVDVSVNSSTALRVLVARLSRKVSQHSAATRGEVQLTQ